MEASSGAPGRSFRLQADPEFSMASLHPLAAVPAPRAHQCRRAKDRDGSRLSGSPGIDRNDRAIQDVALLVHERAFAREHPRRRRPERQAAATPKTASGVSGSPGSSLICIRFSNSTVRSTVVPVTTPSAPISSRIVWMAVSPTGTTRTLRRWLIAVSRADRIRPKPARPRPRPWRAARKEGETIIAIADSAPMMPTTTSTLEQTEPCLVAETAESPCVLGCISSIRGRDCQPRLRRS